jgi:hypothetical protein
MAELQTAIARLRRAAAELGLLADGAPQGLALEVGGPA